MTEKKDKGKMVAVHSAGRSLRKREEVYRALRKGAAVVIVQLHKSRHHHRGGPCIVCSDDNTLRVAFEKVDILGRLVKCLDMMS